MVILEEIKISLCPCPLPEYMELPTIAGIETEEDIAEYYTSPEFAK